MLSDLINPRFASEADSIFLAYDGGRKFLTIAAALSLGIFPAIVSPQTPEAVARKIGADATFTEDILIALSSMRLAIFGAREFKLSDSARYLLLPDSPGYIGALIRLDDETLRRFIDLAKNARTGARPGKTKPSGEDAWGNTFIRAMKDIAVTGGADWLIGRVDLTGRCNLLDVGGGPGIYDIAFCQAFPSLKATVWDLPTSLEIASKYVEHAGMSDRISLQPGDWDTDDFSAGYDALMMSNVLHGEGFQAGMKLKKAFEALEPGGLLIIHDFLIRDDNSGPEAAALFRIMVGAYHQSELLQEIKKAGFIDVRLVDCDEGRGNCLVTAVRP